MHDRGGVANIRSAAEMRRFRNAHRLNRGVRAARAWLVLEAGKLINWGFAAGNLDRPDATQAPADLA